MAKVRKKRKDIVERYARNPIITTKDIPIPCNTVFNAAATIYNKEYILLVRVEGVEGKSSLWIARSQDGLKFDIDKKPALVRSNQEPFKTYEKRGLEDPRITKMDDTYYIIYTAYSHYSPRLGLARTKDFKNFERVALISEPVNKDAVIFPKKFKKRYVRYDRPMPTGIATWISYSYDLIHWGDSKVVFETRPGYWDADRVGPGAPPIRTKKGWLLIYHGVKNTSAGPIYRLGVALFDLKDPSKLIGRSREPILSPYESYERTGDVPNVVFTTGAILEKSGEVKIYYGAADTCICLGTAHIDDLLALCKKERPEE
ncbi:MAG: glycoside hydrolase family 130 protein [Candidatus Aminicenantales bacterium]